MRNKLRLEHADVLRYVVHVVLEFPTFDFATRRDLRFIARRAQSADFDSLIDDGLTQGWPKVKAFYPLALIPKKKPARLEPDWLEKERAIQKAERRAAAAKKKR